MEDPKSGAIWAFALPMLVVIIVSIIVTRDTFIMLFSSPIMLCSNCLL